MSIISFRIMVFILFLATAVVTPPIKAINPRRLEDTAPTTANPAGSGSPNDEMRCGSCPCGTTCYSSPPPPSPSLPPPLPPPSPSPPPPSPPPPPKKPSPTPGAICPPPPSGGGGGGRGGSGGGGGGGSGHAPPDYIYITGPPGDLYPVVQSVSAAGRSFTVAPAVLVFTGLLGMLARW